MSHVLTDVLGAWHARSGVAHRTPDRSARHAAELVPPLSPGERALARSGEPARPVVGTDRALYVRNGHGDWSRTGWADIALIGWSRPDQTIEARLWSAGVNASPLRIAAGRRFAAFAGEQVSATRLFSTRAEILPGVTGLVVAVRDGADGTRWEIALDPHEDVDGNALRAACTRLIDELRGLAGC